MQKRKLYSILKYKLRFVETLCRFIIARDEPIREIADYWQRPIIYNPIIVTNRLINRYLPIILKSKRKITRWPTMKLKMRFNC